MDNPIDMQKMQNTSKATGGKILELTATDMRAFQLQTLYANKVMEQEKSKEKAEVKEVQDTQKLKEIELKPDSQLVVVNANPEQNTQQTSSDLQSTIKTVDQILTENAANSAKKPQTPINTAAVNSKTSTIGQIIAQNTVAKQQAQAIEQAKQDKINAHHAAAQHTQHAQHTHNTHNAHHQTHKHASSGNTLHTATNQAVHALSSDLEKKIMTSIEKLSQEIIHVKLKHTISEIVSDLQSLIHKLERMHE